MKEEIKLKILGLVYNQAVVTSYGLVLGEEEGRRRFSIMIGEPEAQSIALKINNKHLARPLTHDLLKNILEELKVNLIKVLIYDLANDIFCSKLFLESEDGKISIIDARTSDAVALAVRYECAIYIKKEILDIVGTEVTEPELTIEKPTQNLDDFGLLAEEDMSLFPEKELSAFLKQAVKEEKYELAVKIRNALNKKDKDN